MGVFARGKPLLPSATDVGRGFLMNALKSKLKTAVLMVCASAHLAWMMTIHSFNLVAKRSETRKR